MVQKIKKFAEGTTVSIGDTKRHIEKELARYGVSDNVVIGKFEGRCMVTFQFVGDEFTRTVRLWFQGPAKGYRDSEASLDRETSRLWRCMFLTLKAKLESVHSGIETFDEAFMPHIMTPNGTVGDQVLPQMKQLVGGEPVKLLM